jgi:hypothetical protein
MSGLALARGLGPVASRKRSLATALTVLSWLLGSLVLHTGLEQHSGLDGPTRVFFTQHSGSVGECLETARVLEVPTCPACVLQLQTGGASTPASLAPIGLVRLGEATVVDLAPCSGAAPRLVASRGPPLA